MDATALMDWAEGRYGVFFPGHSQNQTITLGSDNYVFRAYPNNTYLGITDQGAVDVLSPALNGGSLWHVGRLADFTCQVFDCNAAVTGTAAAGAPIAGVTVTLKDSTNHAVTATTSVTGAYSLSTAGMTGPFLLQLTRPGASPLYGATVDTGSTIVANLTPLTDLIVRTWYSVQGVSADSAFASPVAAPPPTQQQARSVAEVVLSVMQLALNNSNSGISAPLDLINKPFIADHTGFDDVLDKTRITYGAGATVTVSGTSTAQTSVIGFDPAAGSITASSTTTGGGNTSTSSISAVVPVSSPQATASNEIEAALSAFASLVNAKGTALAKSDLLPLLDPDLLDDGLNRDQFAQGLISNFQQGQSLSVQLRRINNLDLAAGRAEVTFAAIQSLGSQTSNESLTFDFRKVAGRWTLSGNQRIARISINAEARINQGSFNQDSGPSINVDVRPVQGTVSNVAVATPAGSIAITRGPTAVDESGVFLDTFFGNTGPLSAGLLPAAGTPFNVTMTRPASAPVSLTIPLNAFTTEGVPITSPTGSKLADAHLGGTLDVSWRLPSTYAVAHVSLSALVFTGSQSSTTTFQCESPEVVLGAAATSGTLSVPAICNGLPVVNVNINLGITGINGERSQTIHMLQ
ncbi:MAG TPA: hypothetical protein VN649_12750 [Ramlibacter sp.]|nr:hypothetical protein [Ramlibacter sp.]